MTNENVKHKTIKIPKKIFETSLREATDFSDKQLNPY